jgi:hypothetical protein
MLDENPRRKLGETRGGVEGVQILAARRADHRSDQKRGRGGRRGGRKTLPERKKTQIPPQKKKEKKKHPTGSSETERAESARGDYRGRRG